MQDMHDGYKSKDTDAMADLMKNQQTNEISSAESVQPEIPPMETMPNEPTAPAM